MRDGVALALAVLAAATPASAASPPAGPSDGRLPVLRTHPVPRSPGSRLFRRRDVGLRPFHGRRGAGPYVPPHLLPSPPPDTFLQPEGPGPSPLIEGRPDDLPAFAHGFRLSVAVGAEQVFAVPATLDRFRDVGQALGACFVPPAAVTWGAVTLRVSFKRDGSVFGLPRVAYSDAATADQKSELARSVLAGLKRCAPLPVSPSLGAAIAGEIFAIRFIHEDKR